MNEGTSLPSRQSVRLDRYDYSQPGMYYVTVCAYRKECIFGNVAQNAVTLNELGETVQRCWLVIPQHFPSVRLDAHIVMPNHIHAIFAIRDEGAKSDLYPEYRQRQAWRSLSAGEACLAPTGGQASIIGKRTVAAIIGSFKSAATREARTLTGQRDLVVWQRGYFEHIISTESGLNQIRQYILENPMKWGDAPESIMGE
jgi:putative transposase